MKVELTEQQLKQIKEAEQHSQVCSFLANPRPKFNIGDVLVKKVLREDENGNKKWITEKVSSSDGAMPKRFVYVYENEHGVGFLKSLRIDGKLGSDVICLADIPWYSLHTTRYEIDTDYADLSLFGNPEDFDIKKLQGVIKEKRKKVKDMNKASAFKTLSLVELNSFFEKIGVNGSFWGCHYKDASGLVTKYTIRSIKKKYINKLSWHEKDQYEEEIQYASFNIDDNKIVALEVLEHDYNSNEEYFSTSFNDTWLFTTEPLTVDDI